LGSARFESSESLIHRLKGLSTQNSTELGAYLLSRSLCALRLSSPCVDDAVIRIYDEAGNVIETQEHAGDFKEP
jgi:hypothetical protein